MSFYKVPDGVTAMSVCGRSFTAVDGIITVDPNDTQTDAALRDLGAIEIDPPGKVEQPAQAILSDTQATTNATPPGAITANPPGEVTPEPTPEEVEREALYAEIERLTGKRADRRRTLAYLRESLAEIKEALAKAEAVAAAAKAEPAPAEVTEPAAA